MSFSRWWTETTATLGDRVPLPAVLLLLLVAAALAALAWHTFPAWVPRRLPRLRLPRLRLPRLRLRLPRFRLPRLRLPRLRRCPRPDRKATPAAEPAPPAPQDVPTGPAPAHLSLADRLAAEGRYAEAVRERLRDMIAELVARQVVSLQPGLTVIEVVSAAARNRPPTGPPVAAAGAIFADLWYAQRPASAEHDRRMRDLAADLHRVLTGPPGTTLPRPTALPAVAPPPAVPAGPPATSPPAVPPAAPHTVPEQAAAREDRP
ncbi:DUF4129 domain-containing protein [Micromonospora sp. WMMD812]|uniref:DUF4129 domain-containing protein n=1 Tax=Micromonospora sp. WMMD812 TaxID=3015152 RepID=UPI00248C8454|nr:DUF4129 domain-containing protein [Micromonospora sp. WMMD812]WBB64851.1 DUF4129 domain-containing protein [Micromonospora sp. WMMD812]